MRSSTVSKTTVAVGGTFDVLHSGHKRLLAKAFEVGDIVFIGVSGDRLVPRLDKNHPVRSFAARYLDLRNYIQSMGLMPRTRIVELKDPFGPAARRKRLDGIVVSQETRSSGVRLNSLRMRRGLPPVRLYIVRLLKAEDGLPITSTRVRSGEIDLEGRLIRTSHNQRKAPIRHST